MELTVYIRVETSDKVSNQRHKEIQNLVDGFIRALKDYDYKVEARDVQFTKAIVL